LLINGQGHGLLFMVHQGIGMSKRKLRLFR